MLFSPPKLLPLLSLTSLAHTEELSASGRWVLNKKGDRIKLRCVNWAGHGETNIPEGLQSQNVNYIANWIADAGFNCVRLTFSIDMANNPRQKVSESFVSAANSTGTGDELIAVYHQAVAKNPFLKSGTTRGAFVKVIDALKKRNILVILDNHNSKSGWCCSTNDGNGWWKEASGYNAANSRNFDSQDWLDGLTAMAKFSKNHWNVVGVALRNELRAVGQQDKADWYKFVAKGAAAVHQANPKALIVIGGINWALDLSMFKKRPFDRSGLGNKVLWEWHSYEWSDTRTKDCPAYTQLLENTAGFVLEAEKPYTGPLFLSEYGWNQNQASAGEQKYFECLVKYLEKTDAEFAYWALQGSYYFREGRVNYDESFGLVDKDWKGWRNPDFVKNMGNTWNITQRP